MTMLLLAPAALAALAVVLLPLLIHLARRGEQHPTDFAALRWLRQKPKPRRRLRFDEWPLLLLRLLLLALLGLWLARPMLSGSASEAPWVAVVPGIDVADARAAVTDPDARVSWLAPGFPELDQPLAVGPLPIVSLLRQLDAELPSAVALSVLVPEVLQGVDAQRPQLSRAVEWRVMPGAMPAAMPAANASMPKLAIRHAPERAEAVRYLRAAALAWQLASKSPGKTAAPNFSTGPLSQPLDNDTRWLIWLAPGALPRSIETWIAEGGVALVDAETTSTLEGARVVLWRDALGKPLAESLAQGKGRLMRLTGPLAPADMPQLLEPGFPRRLRALFQAQAPAPMLAPARAVAPLTGGDTYRQAPRDLQPWLALLIALTLLLERGLATRRRRGIAP